MKPIRYLCLLVTMLSIPVQAASPLAGTWEGQLHGIQAITLKIRQDGGKVSGSVVFYILKDEGSGWHVGDPTEPLPLLNPRWDGMVLRFSVSHSGDWLVPFEMRLSGFRTAEAKRLAAHGEPEQVVSLPVNDERGRGTIFSCA